MSRIQTSGEVEDVEDRLHRLVVRTQLRLDPASVILPGDEVWYEDGELVRRPIELSSAAEADARLLRQRGDGRQTEAYRQQLRRLAAEPLRDEGDDEWVCPPPAGGVPPPAAPGEMQRFAGATAHVKVIDAKTGKPKVGPDGKVLRGRTRWLQSKIDEAARKAAAKRALRGE